MTKPDNGRNDHVAETEQTAPRGAASRSAIENKNAHKLVGHSTAMLMRIFFNDRIRRNHERGNRDGIANGTDRSDALRHCGRRPRASLTASVEGRA